VKLWTPVERPGSRTRRSWAFDVAVAAFVLLTSSTSFTPRNSLSSLPVWAAVVIVLAMVIPLVLRRVWPVPVFGFIFLVAAATGWWANQIAWSPALVVALYTVAALRPRREALAAAAALTVAAVAAAVHTLPHSWAIVSAALIAVIIAATGLGLYASTRRVLLEELRERAARLELERNQQSELAAAAERARIAREMHDIVAHHLTVMVALADGAAAQAPRDSAAAAEVMRTVSATGRVALADTRRLLGVLRDDSADSSAAAERAPLPDLAALDELVERVRAAGLDVRYEVEGERPDVAAAAQLTLFRLVQESLTNTIKHAGAGAKAAVRVRYAADEVIIDVEDDGRGAVAMSGDGGRGLVGMRERVAAFGGTVSAGPRSPRGWLVSARLRLDGANRP
jgi:signal transduction histidine kinase